MSSHGSVPIHSSARSSLLAIAVLCFCTVFAVLYVWWLASSGLSAQPWTIVALVAVKAATEIVASVYAITFLCAAVAYLFSGQDDAPDDALWLTWPRVAVVYLCCGDLDVAALRSLASLRYDGNLTIVVHDDASARTDREAVDA